MENSDLELSSPVSKQIRIFDIGPTISLEDGLDIEITYLSVKSYHKIDGYNWIYHPSNTIFLRSTNIIKEEAGQILKKTNIKKNSSIFHQR